MQGLEVVTEVARTGGRVDLLYEDGTAVEVKRQATVRAHDQARRYLRDEDVSRVLIVCLDASENLRAVCEETEKIELEILDPAHHPELPAL